MNINKHFPLSKPPQVVEDKTSLPTPITAQITRQRVAALNRYNKIFFVFGLLSLVLGLFSYLEWSKDKDKLDRYETIFDRFPEKSILTIKNDSGNDLFILNFNISYVVNEEDSIKYHKYDIASLFKREDKLLKLEADSLQEFMIPKERENDKVKGLFFGLYCLNMDYKPKSFSSTVVPKNSIISIK